MNFCWRKPELCSNRTLYFTIVYKTTCWKYPAQRARGPRAAHTVTLFERGMITQVLRKKLCDFIIALKSYRLTLQTKKSPSYILTFLSSYVFFVFPWQWVWLALTQPLPHNAAFWWTKDIYLWKTLWEKEKLLVTSNFSRCFLPYMVLIFHFKKTLKCCLWFVLIWTSLKFCWNF